MAHKIPKIQYKNASLSGVRTSGSAIITGISITSSLAAGMVVTGTGIPASTAILTVDSSTQVTLTKNATASGTSTLEFYFEIVFDYPPIETTGEKYDSVEHVVTANDGTRQVSVDYIEVSRSLLFSFLSESLKVSLDTFYTSYAYLGGFFRYFEDQTTTSYVSYQLFDLKHEPKKIAAKGPSAYVWSIPYKFRRVI